MRPLQSGLFDVIISIVILIFSIEVNINIVFAHDSNILLPNLSNSVFDIDHSYLCSLLLDQVFLHYPHTCPVKLQISLLIKAFIHFQQVSVKKGIQVD